MIIERLKKDKKNTYTIVVDEKTYTFDEEIILEYRLVQGKEISIEVLELAQKKNQIIEYYNKALNYSLKYAKGSEAVRQYLLNKGVSSVDVQEIIDRLARLKVIQDEVLIKNLVTSLAKKGNGRMLIEKKLYEQRFPSPLISKAVSQMDMQEYNDALVSLYEKIKFKYKDDSYIRIMKIKKYLLSRGYTYTDLQVIDFNS